MESKVGKLAGLPDEVVRRAREVLIEHELAEQRATAHLSPELCLRPHN